MIQQKGRYHVSEGQVLKGKRAGLEGLFVTDCETGVAKWLFSHESLESQWVSAIGISVLFIPVFVDWWIGVLILNFRKEMFVRGRWNSVRMYTPAIQMS